MKAIYANFVLWLIRPALEKHRAGFSQQIKINSLKEREFLLDSLERSRPMGGIENRKG